jgi:hypothetical protein
MQGMAVWSKLLSAEEGDWDSRSAENMTGIRDAIQIREGRVALCHVFFFPQ